MERPNPHLDQSTNFINQKLVKLEVSNEPAKKFVDKTNIKVGDVLLFKKSQPYIYTIYVIHIYIYIYIYKRNVKV